MAIFKVVNEVYKSEEDLKRLISYVYSKALYWKSYNTITNKMDLIEKQFLYIQKCYGGELRTRALHYVLSFDNRGWEHWMKLKKINQCTFLYALYERFKNYQFFAAVHNHDTHMHIHFIINPVNRETLKVWHCSESEWNRMMQDMAYELFVHHKLALQSISYIDENGKLQLGNQISPFLYMNRDYSYDKLK